MSVATIAIIISSRTDMVGAVVSVVELVLSSKEYMMQLRVIVSHRLGQDMATWSDMRSIAVRT